jgi:hypothetical protein
VQVAADDPPTDRADIGYAMILPGMTIAKILSWISSRRYSGDETHGNLDETAICAQTAV